MPKLEREQPSTREVEQLIKTMADTSDQILRNMAEVTMPLLKEYVRDLRSVRMAIDAEVSMIIQTVRTLQQAQAGQQSLDEFVRSMETLNRILTPEFIDKIQKLIKTS